MLPEEILDYILSLCEDVHCLEASSRAHPILSRIAERHLYADIVLHNHAKYDPYDDQLPLNVGQLSSLLSQRPRVASYVHSLTIETSSEDDDLAPFLEAVPPILILLPKLRMLGFDCRTPPRFEVDPTFPQRFCLSLEKPLGLPSMREVNFFAMEIPITLLHHCGNAIKRLSFEFSKVYKPDEVENWSDCPQLEELSVIDVDNLSLDTLVPWAASGCGQLSQLRFSPFNIEDGDAFMLIKPVLVKCSNTLTILEVDVASLYNHHDGNTFESWTLPTLHHLQSFSFHGKTFYLRSHNTCFHVLTWLLGPMRNLKRLVLHLHFEIDSLDTNWSGLDALLATFRSSTRFIYLGISTRLDISNRSGHELIMSKLDVEPHLMGHPNMREMVEQKVLDIRILYDGCYCSSG